MNNSVPKCFKKGRPSCKFLEVFINKCLTICRKYFPGHLGEYYASLLVQTYDRETGDSILGAHPLKLDLIGVRQASVPFPTEQQFWWNPSNSQQIQIDIVAEVKNDFSTLLTQVASYARGLLSSSPLRQFALVLGYEHQNRRLYFIVFYNGGVSMTEALSLTDVSHRKEILRLFLAILTWKTPGDAGIPEWFEGRSLWPPRSANDAQGVLTNVSRILSGSLNLRSEF